MRLPELDWQAASEKLEDFIQEQTAAAGISNVVVGVSGGLDSSVALVLASRALGSPNVFAFSLPGPSTSEVTCHDASDLAASLGVPFATVDLQPQVEAYFSRFPDADRLRRGNKAARERMSILYDQAAALDALVCGTSNKTEWLLGYGTTYGDMACAFNPLGDLYKTEVRGLAEWLGLPEAICSRIPSAELWEDQTDEVELGFTYAEVDLLLWVMIDRGMSDQELLEGGYTPGLIEDVKLRIEGSAFKRRMPPVCVVHD